MRRVGTFTMGISLIFIGLTLIASLFLNLQYVSLIFKFWPVILIMLGVEVLFFLKESKKDGKPVKYDFASIAIIMLVLFFSMGIFVVSTLASKYIVHII